MTDPASRAAHSYQAAGQTTATVESTYETGPFAAPISRPVAAATGSISFAAKVDSKNAGVSLVRLGDQAAAYQQAAVFVDDQQAGTWTQPLGNTTARWLEDHFDVPSSLTAGKRSVTVRLEPVGGSPAWSAARYRVLSVVTAYVDTSAPGIGSGLRATGGSDNALSLQWSEADDNVATTAYEVYGSTDPRVPVSANTLLATVPTPGFRHAGLGLEETWNYRVRAVDAAGNAGKLSAVASATTGTELDVEAELLLPAIGADVPVEAQGNCCGVEWSNNAQLWFRADSAGDAVTVGLDIPAAGSYALSGVLTQAVDYGVVTLALDGHPLGSAFDGFHSPNVVVAPAVDYGTVELSEGSHELTVTVTGKNPSSTGFLAGLDRLHLSKI